MSSVPKGSPVPSTSAAAAPSTSSAAPPVASTSSGPARAAPAAASTATAAPASPGSTSSSSASSGAAANRTCGSVFLERLRNVPVVRAVMGMYRRVREAPVVGGAVRVWERATDIAVRPAAAVLGPVMTATGAAAAAEWGALRALDAAEVVLPCAFAPQAQMGAACTTGVANCVCCLPRAAGATCNVCRRRPRPHSD